MAVNPINISRISHNLQTNFVLQSLRQTQRDMFVSQTRIATGRSFVTPGEDPVAAARALDLSQALARQQQFTRNARHGDNMLAAADNALVEVNDLVTQASVIASEMVNSLATEAEREAEAELVAAIREQVQSVANRQLDGRFIFAGRATTDQPFIDALGGVAYVGDIRSLMTRVAEQLLTPISKPGNEVFAALSRPIENDADLTPVLTADTRLDALNGATGTGITAGTLIVNEPAGAGSFTVDLADADTIGDVVDLINEAAAEAGAGVTASLSDTGLVLTPGGSAVAVTDRAAGATAATLGIYTPEPTTDVIDGADMGVRVTRLTPVDALAGGNGIDLDGGLIITNAGRTATIDLSQAQTVQDIINTINNAGVFVHARVNDAGTGIDVFNQVSGRSLTIGENGGTTAADLGIRTFDAATSLDRLNLGLGVTTVEGKDDLRITARDGSVVDVNLDGAQTIGDVIDRINEAAQDAGTNIQAGLTETGNGIQITDATGGAGRLSVSALNMSTAARQLGLDKTADPAVDTLVGDDVNPTRTDGILGALIELEEALRADDTQRIAIAGGRLDGIRDELTRVQGIIGARSQGVARKVQQIQDAAASTEIFLSEIKDLDFAEAATRMQSAVAQLQANLQTSSNLLSLSLLDFLR